MRRAKTTFGSFPIACALAIGLVACGGDSDGGEGGGTPTQASEASGTAATAAEEGMPNLVGATLSEAQEELSALASYDLKISYEKSGEPPGTVIDQSAAAGSPLTSAKRIEITVSEVSAGDPCDETDLAAAEVGGPLSDCDPVKEEVVNEGMRCEGRGRSGILGNLECDPARVCGGYVQWTQKGRRTPCTLGPVPGLSGEVGDPCVPGQPAPPGLVCKPE